MDHWFELHRRRPHSQGIVLLMNKEINLVSCVIRELMKGLEVRAVALLNIMVALQHRTADAQHIQHIHFLYYIIFYLFIRGSRTTALVSSSHLQSCYGCGEKIWPCCDEPYSAEALIRRCTRATDYTTKQEKCCSACTAGGGWCSEFLHHENSTFRKIAPPHIFWLHTKFCAAIVFDS